MTGSVGRSSPRQREEWPRDSQDRPVKYVDGKDWLIFGIPRCPTVTEPQIWNSDGVEAGYVTAQAAKIGKFGGDHYLGQNSVTCSICKLYTDGGNSASRYRIGEMWQWLKKNGYDVVKRESRVETVYQHLLDPKEVQAQAHAASEAEKARAMLQEVEEEEPEARVPFLIRQRWVAEARRKKRRHA